MPQSNLTGAEKIRLSKEGAARTGDLTSPDSETGTAPAPGAVNRASAIGDSAFPSTDVSVVANWVRREGAPNGRRGGCAPSLLGGYDSAGFMRWPPRAPV